MGENGGQQEIVKCDLEGEDDSKVEDEGDRLVVLDEEMEGEERNEKRMQGEFMDKHTLSCSLPSEHKYPLCSSQLQSC